MNAMFELAPKALDMPWGEMSNFLFFAAINEFLREEISIFQWNLLINMTKWVSIVALTATTLWVVLQGYRLLTGQSRANATEISVTALRVAFIVMLATSMGLGGKQMYWALTDGLSKVVSGVVTGDQDPPYSNIDQNLALMQMAMMSIDALETSSDPALEKKKDQAQLFTGIGIAGPAITGGALLLLNKVAMALFIGLGPLFILCLIFDQTKQMFQKWLFYGIGTMFSLAVLTVMVKLTTKVVGAVALAFVTKYLTSGALGNSEGINSMALQQGGLGLVMTTLILSAPPMAAAFFQGTLGNFMAFSQFGGSGGAMGQRPGEAGHRGTDTTNASTPRGQGDSRVKSTPSVQLTSTYGQQSVGQTDVIKKGHP